MTASLTPCKCGSTDTTVENCFGILFVECGGCGARGKHFPVSTKVDGQWPREAAMAAWNRGEMDDDAGGAA